ncbi:uncharacterized protein [Salvelinus alpinus]|uniref:uncharacterized protein isoform X4 n=1 Tax=Salvelinus alpinus TaxID=8036 RepID=UPI0039FD0914
MALRTAGSVLVVFLWSVTVVLSQNGWSVTYTTQSICTLKGSTVELSCSYTYPKGYIVTTTLWFTKIIDVENYVSLLDDPDYKGCVTYRSDKTNGHTLTITHLRESDSATYMFRFITDQTGGKYVGSPGVTLSVTDLQVKVTTTWWSTTLTCSTTCTLTDGPKNTSVSVSPSGEIVEGSSVNLTCSSDANPPVDKYTWYKITYKKMSMRHSGQRYAIHNISSEDREGYYCEALNIIGREHIPVHINVTYTAAVLPWVPVVGVGAVLTVGALLLTIYCCMKRRSTGGSDATADTQNVRDSPVTQPLRKMLSPPIIRTEENDHRTWNEENNHRTWTEENHHRTWTEQNHHIP